MSGELAYMQCNNLRQRAAIKLTLAAADCYGCHIELSARGARDYQFRLIIFAKNRLHNGAGIGAGADADADADGTKPAAAATLTCVPWAQFFSCIMRRAERIRSSLCLAASLRKARERRAAAGIR